MGIDSVSADAMRILGTTMSINDVQFNAGQIQ